MRTIALLSDFGHRDAYVGVMKSVILGISPEVRLLDLCHEIPPQNVLSGAYQLAAAAPYLSAGTIVLGVVDPGVGGSRRAIAVACDGVVFIGPDNGLFSMAWDRRPVERAVELADPTYRLPQVSTTFHGRDIFAPAAAHLATGVSLDDLGPALEVSGLVRLPGIGPMIKANSIECTVVHLDHFGNAITNLHVDTLVATDRVPASVVVHETRAPFGEGFFSVEPQKPVAYVGSSGYVELGVRNGNGASRLNMAQGTLIHVELD